MRRFGCYSVVDDVKSIDRSWVDQLHQFDEVVIVIRGHIESPIDPFSQNVSIVFSESLDIVSALNFGLSRLSSNIDACVALSYGEVPDANFFELLESKPSYCFRGIYQCFTSDLSDECLVSANIHTRHGVRWGGENRPQLISSFVEKWFVSDIKTRQIFHQQNQDIFCRPRLDVEKLNSLSDAELEQLVETSLLADADVEGFASLFNCDSYYEQALEKHRNAQKLLASDCILPAVSIYQDLYQSGCHEFKDLSRFTTFLSSSNLIDVVVPIDQITSTTVEAISRASMIWRRGQLVIVASSKTIHDELHAIKWFFNSNIVFMRSGFTTGSAWNFYTDAFWNGINTPVFVPAIDTFATGSASLAASLVFNNPKMPACLVAQDWADKGESLTVFDQSMKPAPIAVSPSIMQRCKFTNTNDFGALCFDLNNSMKDFKLGQLGIFQGS